ncbi:hypothetical protein DEU53_104161 [Pantoea sp. AG1095]|jgi:hypothetical protein|nr:hypothetical protein DEU53_104161 [Pantoea sp. AG1095]
MLKKIPAWSGEGSMNNMQRLSHAVRAVCNLRTKYEAIKE